VFLFEQTRESMSALRATTLRETTLETVGLTDQTFFAVLQGNILSFSH
jgi:hypothetical protein